MRERPLTPEEVGSTVSRMGPQLKSCYQRHRLSFGLKPLADFKVRLRIPSDGSPHVAEVVEASEAGQEPLGECIVNEMEGLRFPAHSGEPVVVDVPIRAPSR